MLSGRLVVALIAMEYELRDAGGFLGKYSATATRKTGSPTQLPSLGIERQVTIMLKLVCSQ